MTTPMLDDSELKVSFANDIEIVPDDRSPLLPPARSCANSSDSTKAIGRAWPPSSRAYHAFRS